MRHPAPAAGFAAITLLLLTLSPSRPGGPQAVAAQATAAQDSSALINEALDKPVTVELNTAILKALDEIKDKTGVPVELAPGVLDLLPWGEQTNIQATIGNQTLRNAIAAIAQRLGLVSVLTAEAIELRPMPALARLGRRATVEEIDVLNLLASKKLDLDNPRPTLSELLEAVDQKLISLKSPFAVEFRPGRSVKDVQVVAVPRNAMIAEGLDAIAKETSLAWGPWGRSVLVKPKEAWVRDQLEKSLTRRFDAVNVQQVLSELSEFSGADFEIEPGAVQRIPPQSQTITLILQNRSVGQALQDIAGFTGLGHTVREDGVYIWNTSQGGAAGGGSQDPVIAILPLPESGMEIMLRRSEVPDDVRQYIRHRFGKEIAKLREMMKEEGFVPTTQPTTAPVKPAEEEEKDL